MKIDEAVEHIRKLINYEFEFEKDCFIEFDGKRNCEAYAIDGSSVKLFDAYSFSIFARRVGYVLANEEKVKEKNIEDFSIDIIYGENAERENDERREREEYELAKKCAESGVPVILDGCLLEKVEGIVEGIIGISKKSGYKMGNAPMLFLLKKFGDNILPDKRWYYKIEDGIYAVKFHPYARFIFRVDYMGNDIEGMLSEISALCNDVSCLGYPYPLAEAHKAVKISKEERNYLKYIIQQRVMETGVNLSDWENIFYDYHEYLEG